MYLGATETSVDLDATEGLPDDSQCAIPLPDGPLRDPPVVDSAAPAPPQEERNLEHDPARTKQKVSSTKVVFTRRCSILQRHRNLKSSDRVFTRRLLLQLQQHLRRKNLGNN